MCPLQSWKASQMLHTTAAETSFPFTALKLKSSLFMGSCITSDSLLWRVLCWRPRPSVLWAVCSHCRDLPHCFTEADCGPLCTRRVSWQQRCGHQCPTNHRRTEIQQTPVLSEPVTSCRWLLCPPNSSVLHLETCVHFLSPVIQWLPFPSFIPFPSPIPSLSS